jgi:hypothetical protein
MTPTSSVNVNERCFTFIMVVCVIGNEYELSYLEFCHATNNLAMVTSWLVPNSPNLVLVAMCSHFMLCLGQGLINQLPPSNPLHQDLQAKNMK